MTCPLCQNGPTQVIHPYWQESSLALAHKINLDWPESDGSCQHCFDSILQTLDEVSVWKPNFAVRGVSEGYR